MNKSTGQNHIRLNTYDQKNVIQMEINVFPHDVI